MKATTQILIRAIGIGNPLRLNVQARVAFAWTRSNDALGISTRTGGDSSQMRAAKSSY